MTNLNEGGGETRDVTILHTAVAALARAARAARIYLPNNEVLLTFKGELNDQLEAALAEEGELELVFRSGGEIVHDGAVVYRDLGDSDGLAAKLHRDGMRKLIFRSGLTAEELDDLLDVVTTDYEDDTNLEDDLVTKVWEKEFEHIQITITEELLASTDVWDPDAVDPSKVQSYLGYDGSEPGEDGDAAPPEGKAFLGPMSPATYQHAVTMEELVELEREVQRARRADPLVEFNELLFEILDNERTGAEVQVLLTAAARNLRALAEQGSFVVAAETVERLRSVALLLDVPDLDVAPLVETILTESSEETVARALSYAEQAQDVRTEELASYLKVLEPSAVPLLLERLADVRKPHIRTALVESITEHCRERFELLGARLAKDPSSPAVRDLLAIMAAIGNPRAMRYFKRFLKHPDAGVRSEVVRALGRFDTAEVPDLLVSLIEDPEERIRLAAVRQLAFRKDALAQDSIQSRIDSAEFERLSLTEQRYLFTAVAVIGGPDVVPYLAGFLDEATGFGGRGSARGLNAVQALAAIGHASARAALERGASAGPKRIREACAKALARLGPRKDTP